MLKNQETFLKSSPSKDGVPFLLVTQNNSKIGLRTTANLIEVCVDRENKVKESNEGDNCKFQWTEFQK